ncbi:MAG: CHAD domain-containing protein [Flavobacteriales bacterium]|nr:CHAD domain-containing protein [Flavobacteriales bacterium]MCB9193259.1 CHAD domain-containing protein [Flavobacteriales bacterium]
MPQERLEHHNKRDLERMFRGWRRVLYRVHAAHAVCRNTLSEPAVHELRLAARRARSVLLLMALWWPDDPRINVAEEELRSIQKLLGPLRDAQLRVHRCEGSGPEAALRSRAKAEVRRSMPGARKALSGIDPHLPMDLLTAESFTKKARVPGKALKRTERLLRRHWKKYQRRARAARSIRNMEREHRARIALKQYRHLLIVLDPVVKQRVRKWVRRRKELQDRWGEAHDRSLFERWASSQGLGPGSDQLSRP